MPDSVKKKYGLFTILGGGFVLSFGIFLFIYNWEESRIEKEFIFRAINHANAIKQEFDLVEKQVDNARFNIEQNINLGYNNPLAPDDFMPTAEWALIKNRQLLKVAWAIPDSIKRAKGKPQSLIILYVKQGKYADAVSDDVQVGDDYYVNHVNFDTLGKQKSRIQTIITQDAYEKGDEVNLINEINFVAFVAIKTQTAPWFNDIKAGALITEWNIAGLIEHALKEMPVATQDISLFMVHNDGNKREVYSHLSRSRTSDQMDVHTSLHYEVPLIFSGQRWQLSFEAAPQFLKNHPIILAWQALLFSILLTLFLAWRRTVSNKFLLHIKEEVRMRTLELEVSQQALLSSKQRYSTLVEMSLTGILVQKQGKLLFANSYIAEKLGYANHAEGMIGHNILEFIHPEDQCAVAERFEDMSLNNTNYLHTGERYISESGDAIYSDTSSTSIDYEGQPAVLMVIQDVTERHLTELKLQHIDRVESMGVLAGGIAHDFNNILTAILGHASVAMNRVEPDSPLQNDLDAIISASNTAAALCNQMLAYSGKGRFIIQPIDLSHIARDLGGFLDVAIAKDVRINYQLSRSLPAIDADISQIQQVVLNLITNASESMSENRSHHVVSLITIKTGVMQIEDSFLADYIGGEHLEHARYVYLEVADTGCGMDAATKQKIFDPYFTTKFTGRGLGMSALLGIVKGHHGGLNIDSTQGQGTTIKIVFPISNQQPLKCDEPAKLMLESRQLSGTVLVVDDELIVRTAATMMLEGLGLEVITANDGVEGVEMFRKYKDKISLVLLDLTMPNMDGTECFAALKSTQPDVCVFLSSGYNEHEITERFTDTGLAGFIHKPYSIDMLAEKMRQVL